MLVIEEIDSVLSDRGSRWWIEPWKGKKARNLSNSTQRTSGFAPSEKRYISSAEEIYQKPAAAVMYFNGNQYKKYLGGVRSQAHIVPNCSRWICHRLCFKFHVAHQLDALIFINGGQDQRAGHGDRLNTCHISFQMCLYCGRVFTGFKISPSNISCLTVGATRWYHKPTCLPFGMNQPCSLLRWNEIYQWQDVIPMQATNSALSGGWNSTWFFPTSQQYETSKQCKLGI